MAMRRRWGVALGALAVLAIAAPVVWFVAIPAYRPALQPGERLGIDVSHHQGQIDWGTVSTGGIEFAYVKATEGGDHTDTRFAENWRGARAAGIERGAYHFFTLCTPGAAQGRHFLSVAPPESGTLPPAVDLELAGNCGDRPDRDAVMRDLDAFLSAVEDAWGRRVVLYLGADFEERYRVRDELDRPLWLRRLLRRPSDPRWVVWQLWGLSRLDGVRGRVDLNVMRHE